MAARATNLSLRSFRRSGGLKRTSRRLVIWILILLGVLMITFLTAGTPILAAAIPLTLAGGAIAIRFPTPFVVGLFVLSGTFGSIGAFTGFQVSPLMDLLILCLICGGIMRFAFLRRERNMWIWPGVLAFGLYIGLTFCEILTSPDPFAGVDSFRTMNLLMMLVLVIAYAGWRPDTYERMAKGVVAVSVLVGLYATLRWVIGPAPQEGLYAYTNNGAFVTELGSGRLYVIGSFGDQHQLALWSVTAIPFNLAMSFPLTGRWRLAAFAAVGLLVIGLLGSEVRSGLVALVASVAVVVLLFQFCRSYRNLNLGATVLVGLAAAGTIAALYVLTVGPAGTARYSKIFHPADDQAYQQRQGKWAEAIRDLHKHPFGQGLGTAGVTNQQFGRYLTIANAQFDNSYLLVAWQQGFAVMIFFGLALALLASDLARHALGSSDPQRAAIAIGSVGAIIALAIMLYFGSYLDALSIIGPWTLIGLGVAQFSSFEPVREEKPHRVVPEANPASAVTA